MPRYPCPKTGKKNVYPGVTTIIEDCSPKNWGPQWGANQAVEWIRENNEYEPYADKKGEYGGNYYYVSEQGLNNARFHFREVSQKALDIGSEVHNMIEQYLKTGKELESEYKEANNAFGAFLEWADENDLKPITIEQKVYGKKWAGTLDFLGYFNDEVYVIDWKSSKAHYPEMRYQVAAYRSVYCVTDEPPTGCGVLRLDKETGMPDFKDHSKTYIQDLKVFNAMVELYYLKHPRIRANFEKNKEATK